MVTRSAVRQRGAIGLFAAITLGMALLFMLLIVDSGRLYLEQRKLQRIADMAALEAAGQYAVCTGIGPQATAIARGAATRNGHAPLAPLQASCGFLQTGANSMRFFTSDITRSEAIKVDVRHTVATSIAAGVFALVQDGNLPTTTTLHASAVAAKPLPPQAMLRIRTTLVSVDSRQSVLLNGLLSALGSSAQLDLAGWKGIAATDINLLKYLDQLAIELDLTVGDYQQLLRADATVTKLLDAAVKVLQQSGAAAEVVTNLGKLALGSANGTVLQLGDLLDIQNGTAQAGLDTSIQLLQLVQGVIQLAASESAATADLPISVLGLVNGRVRIKVIEPQQISAVGDPTKDALEVHTAQIRAMISLDLPLLTGLGNLLNAVLDLAAPLTNVVNNLLSLNLGATLNSVVCLLGVPCDIISVKLLDTQVHIDVGLEVAEASTRLDPAAKDTFSCSPKSLKTMTRKSAVKLAVGKFESPDAFFKDGTTAVKALPLIDIGSQRCTKLLVLGTCAARVPYTGGGIGIRVDSKVLGSGPVDTALLFSNVSQPPNIGLEPAYLKMADTLVVASLSDTLMGVHLEAFKPTANSGLGQIMVLTAGLLDTVKNILQPVIKGLLSNLLDPLLNGLLKVLGIDLNQAEVGANLTCSSGHAELAL
ncbi:putative membrane protein [Pseudomonas hunanensis]|uniref:Membrane protein n=1 Tax=Pseudomonas hunanensis TaxID=1247546 RepID=A0ACC6K0S7_9PSED|nr:pilus assembly protein TadG-related protein [Pseudomonas hunanensis]MDR6712016.1 putative membrane protein [Pseudomonas hunanensis]